MPRWNGIAALLALLESGEAAQAAQLSHGDWTPPAEGPWWEAQHGAALAAGGS